MEEEKFKGKYRTKSTRMKAWDYSQPGYYFVTICVKNKESMFGEIADGEMELNESGKIVQQYWEEIPAHFQDVELGEFVIMPNHVHGIVVLKKRNVKNVETQHCCVSTKSSNTFYKLKPNSLPVIIRSFKSICARELNKKNPYIGFHWQPKYHDHIIRNEKSLENIRNYIHYNPQNWDEDEYKLC